MSAFSDMMDRLKQAKSGGDKPTEYDRFGALANKASQSGYPPDQAAAMAHKKIGDYEGPNED